MSRDIRYEVMLFLLGIITAAYIVPDGLISVAGMVAGTVLLTIVVSDSFKDITVWWRNDSE